MKFYNSKSIKMLMLFMIVISNLVVLAQIDNAEVIIYDTKIEVSNNRLVRTVHKQIKINNRDGERYTKQFIHYSASSKPTKIKAFISNEQGVVIKKLTKRAIITRSAFDNDSFYEDDFVKEFTLKHNSYPYILDYSYQIVEQEFVTIENWSPVVYWNLPTLNATLEIITPNNYEIRYSNSGQLSFNAKTDEAGVVYKWEAHYNEPLKKEIFAPLLSDMVPSVQVVPLYFSFVVPGKMTTWTSYGNWIYDLIDGLMDLPDSEKIVVEKLVKGIDSDKEKIKKLYGYLQDQTRYLYVGIDAGGLLPYPASYVAQNKYGDCKALSNYFMAILKHVGIESYYSTIYAGDNIKAFTYEFPSHQSNHIVLCVPLEGDTLWVDCTSDNAFSYVGSFIQNREVFVVNKDKSFITKTPALEINDVITEKTIDLYYNDGLINLLSFKSILRGDSYEDIAGINTAYNEHEKKEIIREYFVYNKFELHEYSIDIFNRDSVFINLSYEAEANNYYQKLGNDILVNNIPMDIPKFEKVRDRKLPVQIAYPICSIDTLNIEIPAGYKVLKLPKNIALSNDKYGKYSIVYEIINNKVQVSKSFILNAANYKLTKYPSFYKFVNTIYQAENRAVIALTKN